MTKEVTKTEDIKEGELTTQNYEIVGFDESIIPAGRVAELKEKFVPMLQAFETHNQNRLEILEEFEVYKESGDAVPKKLLDRAFRHRNDIAKIRVAAEKGRKASNEESNKEIKGTNSLVKYINENIASDESAMKGIELYNDKIEADRLAKIGEERIEAVSPYMDTDLMRGTAIAEMDQDVFEAYLLTKKNAFEKAEAEAKAIIEAEEKARIEREAEEKRVREENEKLKKEAEEAEKVRLEKEEADRKEREARELKEAEAIKKQAEVQRLANEERDRANRKAEREALEKREAQEAKELADKKAKEAIEEAERLKKEAEEAKELAKKVEAQRIANANTLAMESTEVTAELIEKAKADGKCVFVQVVSVEMNTGKTGIYIQKSET